MSQKYRISIAPSNSQLLDEASMNQILGLNNHPDPQPSSVAVDIAKKMLLLARQRQSKGNKKTFQDEWARLVRASELAHDLDPALQAEGLANSGVAWKALAFIAADSVAQPAFKEIALTSALISHQATLVPTPESELQFPIVLDQLKDVNDAQHFTTLKTIASNPISEPQNVLIAVRDILKHHAVFNKAGNHDALKFAKDQIDNNSLIAPLKQNLLQFDYNGALIKWDTACMSFTKGAQTGTTNFDTFNSSSKDLLKLDPAKHRQHLETILRESTTSEDIALSALKSVFENHIIPANGTQDQAHLALVNRVVTTHPKAHLDFIKYAVHHKDASQDVAEGLVTQLISHHMASFNKDSVEHGKFIKLAIDGNPPSTRAADVFIFLDPAKATSLKQLAANALSTTADQEIAALLIVAQEAKHPVFGRFQKADKKAYVESFNRKMDGFTARSGLLARAYPTKHKAFVDQILALPADQVERRCVHTVLHQLAKAPSTTPIDLEQALDLAKPHHLSDKQQISFLNTAQIQLYRKAASGTITHAEFDHFFEKAASAFPKPLNKVLLDDFEASRKLTNLNDRLQAITCRHSMQLQAVQQEVTPDNLKLFAEIADDTATRDLAEHKKAIENVVANKDSQQVFVESAALQAKAHHSADPNFVTNTFIPLLDSMSTHHGKAFDRVTEHTLDNTNDTTDMPLVKATQDAILRRHETKKDTAAFTVDALVARYNGTSNKVADLDPAKSTTLMHACSRGSDTTDNLNAMFEAGKKVAATNKQAHLDECKTIIADPKSNAVSVKGAMFEILKQHTAGTSVTDNQANLKIVTDFLNDGKNNKVFNTQERKDFENVVKAWKECLDKSQPVPVAQLSCNVEEPPAAQKKSIWTRMFGGGSRPLPGIDTSSRNRPLGTPQSQVK